MNVCRKCNSAITEGSPFCSQCGNSVIPPGFKQRFLPYLVGILIVGLTTIFLAYGGYLKIGGSQNSRALELSGEIEPKDKKVSVQKGALPEDVRLWLEHLKRVDDSRVELQNSMLGKLNSQIQELYSNRILDLTEDEPETADERASQFKKGRSADSSKLVESVDKEFRNLIRDFQSVIPPEECLPISDLYSSALIGCMESTTKLISVLGNAITNQSMDISELMKMQGESYKTVDQPVSKAQDLVQAICDKYGAPNQYDLYFETGGSKTAVPGMGMEDVLKGLIPGG